MRIFLISFAASFILCSCSNYFLGNIQNSTQLSRNNFVYIGHVDGSASAKYFLGFGGLKHEALMNEAREEMYTKHPLKAGQAYVNITSDKRNKFWIIGITKTYTLNADIIQFLEPDFNKPDTSKLNTSIYKEIIPNEEVVNSFPFKPGDFISYKSNDNAIKSGKILLLTFADSTAIVENIVSQDAPKFKTTLRFSQLLKPIANKDGFAINDKAKILIGENYFNCVIISVKENGADVKLIDEPQKDKIIFAPFSVLKKN